MYSVSEEKRLRTNMIFCDKNNLLLHLKTVLITAGPSVITITNASKQHVYHKFRILFFESKYTELGDLKT